MVVATVEECAKAREIDKIAAVHIKAMDEQFRPVIDAAHQAHKKACAFLSAAQAPFRAIRAILPGKVAVFEEAERRKANEERLRLEAAARAAEQERILADAMAAEEAGDHDTAEAILCETPTAPVINVAPAIPKVEGSGSRTQWGARVVDMIALVRFVAENPTWVHLLAPSQPEINALGRSQKEKLSIPGLEATKRESLVART